MKYLKTLVLMQLKDKLDLSFVKSTKTLIQKIVLTLAKFLVVGAVAYVLCLLLTTMLIDRADVDKLMVVIATFLILTSIITCTVGLVKSLYFAGDNKVLITFPVKNNVIFVSKLIVAYFYETVKMYSLLVPLLLGCMLFSNQISKITLLWALFAMLFVSMAVVLISGLLSIPSLFAVRFLNRAPVVKVILFILALGFGAFATVWLISILPKDIYLIGQQGTDLIEKIRVILISFQKHVLPISYLIEMLIGSKINNVHTLLFYRPWVIFACLIGIVAVLGAIVYFVSRPLFFSMMSKTFEFDKKKARKTQKVKKSSPWLALLKKEFKLCFASSDVSLTFIAMYIIVPVLILLLNIVYAAINPNVAGKKLVYTFNILIMLLPLLASNSLISTLLSREGKAGYMKKTKPINILNALFAKLFFFLLFSIPSVLASVIIFGSFLPEFRWYDVLLLFFAILFMQYGHIFYCATLDVMNPQNEQYATVGESVNNPNEGKATILAFIVSAIMSLLAFVFFKNPEILFTFIPYSVHGIYYTIPIVKLFAIAAVFCAATLYMFIGKVKAYYYEK